MSTPKFLLILVSGLCSACGADVAGTAATTAKLEATQAEQARAQEAQFRNRLGEAMRATDVAASAAAAP